MILLDAHTTSLLALVSSVAAAIGLQLTSRVVKDDPGVRLWTTGLTLSGLGYVLIGLRGLIPDYISIVVANGIFVFGYGQLYLGFRRHYGLPIVFRWDVFGGLLTAILFGFFTYVHPDLVSKIVSISLLLTVLSFRISGLLLFSPVVSQSPDRSISVFLGVSIFCVGGYMLVRAVMTPFFPLPDDFMKATAVIHTLLPLLVATGINICLSIGLPLLVTSRMQNTLKSSEAKFRVTFDQAAVGMSILSAEGKYLAVNEKLCSIVGYAKSELMGKAFAAITVQEHVRDDLHHIEEMLAGRRSSEVWEKRYLRKDGNEVWARITMSIVRPNAESAPYFVTVAEDITSSKANHEELLQYRLHLEELVESRTVALMETEAKSSLILQSTADGLYGVDAHGLLTFINPAACRLLGCTDSDVIGQSPHILFHHSKPDGTPYPLEECPGHNALVTGQDVRVGNEVYWKSDGTPIPVLYVVHPILKDSVVDGAVVSFVDNSDQQAANEAREQALFAAENLARARSEFLANMSHEIRTPLNGVLGFAEIGYRNYQNSEKVLNAFEKIKASGNRLLGVINDILDFSKIDAGKLKIEQVEVDVFEVVNHSVDLVRERATQNDVELRISFCESVPKTCISDPLRVGQVLLNILSNAVKFTAGGVVELKVSHQNDHLIFVVTDTGIGMSQEQMASLFNPFQQADASATRKFGGTGLGLVISKRILDLLQGEITVSSELGRGAEIRFSFPVVIQQETNPSNNIAPLVGYDYPLPLSGVSILLVEDDIVNQEVVSDFLIDSGAQLKVAGSGSEAIDWIKSVGPNRFDVVLMDIQLPEMDGYETTKRIRQIDPNIPVIAQTANALIEDQDRCISAGMAGFISKPIDMDALVRLIRETVDRSAD
jgi:PAS domain S-box-containing protein